MVVRGNTGGLATHFGIVGGGGPCGWVWGRGAFEGRALSQAAGGGAGWGAFDLYCRRSCRSVACGANGPDGKAERPAAGRVPTCTPLCWVAEQSAHLDDVRPLQGSIRPIVLGCAVVRNTRRRLGCCVPLPVCTTARVLHATELPYGCASFPFQYRMEK